MIKILLAPDSYKGSLSSVNVCSAMANGIHKAFPDARVFAFPSSDGGEGFCDCMLNIFGGKKVFYDSFDPLQRVIRSYFIFNKDTNTAYVELAADSGLCLISENERDILRSSSYGTGIALKSAIEYGAKNIYLGLGGSATNDGGMGLLCGMGAVFYDASGNILTPSAANMGKVVSADYGELKAKTANINFFAACDVKNELCGKNGAAYVFAPQKGADENTVSLLDKNLAAFAAAAKIDPSSPGSGAAGGAGGALISVLGAEYISGAMLLVESKKFINAISECDIVITGEGNTDIQTASGKLVGVIATAAKAFGRPCFAVSGGLSDGYELLSEYGVTRFFSLVDDCHDKSYCISHASELISLKLKNIMQEL